MSVEFSEGISVESLDDDVECQKFLSHQQKEYTGLVRFKPSNTIMTKSFCNFQKRIRDFQVRQDDVWICTFPRSGTTWTQEMVWCIMNDLDFEEAGRTKLDARVPFVEFAAMKNPDNLPNELQLNDTIAMAEALPSPRILKTHLTVDLIPRGILENEAMKPKLIYVFRNPRDVCISLHNHLQFFAGYTGTLEDVVDDFLSGMAGSHGPYMDHVLGYWKVAKKCSSDNILLLTYEEMKLDLGKVVRKVSDFLGKDRLDESKEQRLLDHLSFNKMKGNAAINKANEVRIYKKRYNMEGAEGDKGMFINEGKAGSWKKRLTPEMVKKFEEWEIKHLKGVTDFKFTYD